MSSAPRILIVGGGYVGMTTALRLQRRLRSGEATVTVVDPNATMTYQPFLAEATAGSIEPRHVVVSLRKVLRRCEVITASVTDIDSEARVATAVASDQLLQLPYDVLVLAPGSVSRALPLPGLAEHAIGFNNLGEAVHLRNHVLSRLDAASALESHPARRRAALTFTVVGGGYSGVEVIAELEDMAHHALRYYPRLSRAELRWVLVEASDRILPEVSLRLANYTRDRLTERGIEVRLNTRPDSLQGGWVCLSDGDSYAADTIVWTAGVRPSPLLARLGFPVTEHGRVVTTAQLQVVERVWSAGDAAAVPELSVDDRSAICGPTAQHAVRQAKRLADNLIAELRGHPLKPYRHAYAGSVASLGLHKGVAEVYGDQAPWLARLDAPPDLPPDPDADHRPEDSRTGRLGARVALQPRDRHPRADRAPAGAMGAGLRDRTRTYGRAHPVQRTASAS